MEFLLSMFFLGLFVVPIVLDLIDKIVEYYGAAKLRNRKELKRDNSR